MRRKVFLVILLLFCLTMNVKAENIILKECEYTDEYIRWSNLSEKERANYNTPNKCKNINGQLFNAGNNKLTASITDSTYDLRTLGYVTSVKDSKQTNSCWTFAAMGS